MANMVDTDCLIIIPMKDPKLAKTRLGKVVDDETRAALALGLFKNTLRILADLSPRASVLVVTEAQAIADIAVKQKFAALVRTLKDGLNGAVTDGANWAVEQGYKTIVIIPADLALLEVEDLADALQYADIAEQLTLCKSADGGTNCLMVSPPNAIKFCYGINSFNLHKMQGRSADLTVQILAETSMKFDLDSADDLDGLARSSYLSLVSGGLA